MSIHFPKFNTSGATNNGSLVGGQTTSNGKLTVGYDNPVFTAENSNGVKRPDGKWMQLRYYPIS